MEFFNHTHSKYIGIRGFVTFYNDYLKYQYMTQEKAKRENNERIEPLNEKSKAPKNSRKSKIDLRIEDFIKNFRPEHPRAGKEKIKPELDVYCQKIGLKTIPEPTIGRIIRELKEKGEIPKKFKVSLYGKTGKIVIKELKPRKPKPRRKGYQPENILIS